MYIGRMFSKHGKMDRHFKTSIACRKLLDKDKHFFQEVKMVANNSILLHSFLYVSKNLVCLTKAMYCML